MNLLVFQEELETLVFRKMIGLSSIIYKLLADNLQSNLGSFTEAIYACNSDGSIAIGRENIWDANSFSIIRQLSVSSTMMLLDSDDETLYIYDNNTSKIYIVNVAE